MSYPSLVGFQLGLAQFSGPPHSHSTRAALPLWSGLPSWEVQGPSIPFSESGPRPLWGQKPMGYLAPDDPDPLSGRLRAPLLPSSIP